MIHTNVSKIDDTKEHVDVVIKGDFQQVLREYRATGRALMDAVISDAPDPIEAIAEICETLNDLAMEMVKSAKDIKEDKNA